MRLLIILFSFLLSTSLIAAKNADLTSIKKRGTISLATEGAFPPFNFHEGKNLKGFEVDLGNQIATQLGVKAKWKAFPFDSLLVGLNQGRYDFVIASHGITKERAKAVEFATPHYCTGGVVLSRKNGPTTENDLRKKKIAVQVGSTYYKKAKSIKNIKEIKTFPKDSDALQALLSKRVDAMITDRFVAMEILKKHASKNLIIGEMLFSEKIAMAFSKGNTKLRDAINEVLAKLQKDGSYTKLSKKYFGTDVRCK